MIREIMRTENLTWVDIEAPSPSELEQITEKWGLSSHLVQDCLDPEHLPKVEDTSDGLFVILRAFDHSCGPAAATIRELTRKIAAFLRGNTLVTIHRAELPLIKSVTEQMRNTKTISPAKCLIVLAKHSVLTYDQSLENAELVLESVDEELHLRRTSESALLRLHETRRRLFTIKRMLWHSASIIQRMPIEDKALKPAVQDLRETIDGLIFFSDELVEEATSLLNLELGLSAQRNNDTMKVLTVFSAFFMPLTFIVGIYGMNFDVMPELHHPWGYAGIWILMITVAVAIWGWFKHKRWL